MRARTSPEYSFFVPMRLSATVSTFTERTGSAAGSGREQAANRPARDRMRETPTIPAKWGRARWTFTVTGMGNLLNEVRVSGAKGALGAKKVSSHQGQAWGSTLMTDWLVA